MSDYTTLHRKVKAAGFTGALAIAALAVWTFRAWITGGNVQVTIGPLLGGIFVYCATMIAAYAAED